MQTVAGRPGFVAEVHPLMLCRDPLYEATHALLGRVDLAEIAHLAPALAISDSDGVPRLGDVDADKKVLYNDPRLALLREARLGLPEQPSDAQSRVSNQIRRNGHTDLLCISERRRNGCLISSQGLAATGRESLSRSENKRALKIF